jgi:hypothetical protein
MTGKEIIDIYNDTGQLFTGADFCDPSKSWTCIFEIEIPAEPITEDAEFEVVQPKMLEQSKPDE